jgi:transposase
VVLDEALRARLTSLAGSTRGQVRAVLRAKIVLAAAAGASNAAIARTLGVSVNTVRKWRGRFTAAGMEGLKDAPRPGRPRLYDSRVRLAVVASATSAPPHPESTWTHRTIATLVAVPACDAARAARPAI